MLLSRPFLAPLVMLATASLGEFSRAAGSATMAEDEDETGAGDEEAEAEAGDEEAGLTGANKDRVKAKEEAEAADGEESKVADVGRVEAVSGDGTKTGAGPASLLDESRNFESASSSSILTCWAVSGVAGSAAPSEAWGAIAAAAEDEVDNRAVRIVGRARDAVLDSHPRVSDSTSSSDDAPSSLSSSGAVNPAYS